MSNSKLPPVDAEKLSELMDGEWGGLNPSDCVAGICNDDELRSKWARYHLIRDAMNSEPVQVDDKLVSSICSAIADEPAYTNITPFSMAENAKPADAIAVDLSEIQDSSTHTNVTSLDEARTDAEPAATKRSLLGTGLTGFAMAASVALVTVVGMNIWQGQSAPSSDDSAVAVNTGATSGASVGAFSQQIQGAPLPEVEFVGNTGFHWVSPDSSKRHDDEKRLNMFLSQHLENSPTASREGLLSYSRLVGYDERSEEQ